MKGHPGFGGGIPRAREAAALTASFSASGAQRWSRRGLPGHLQVPPRGGSVASGDAGLQSRLEPSGPRASEGQERSPEGEPAGQPAGPDGALPRRPKTGRPRGGGGGALGLGASWRPAMTFGRSGAASVVLNVGGARYSLSRELLKDFPLRRVSRLHGCRSERDVLEVCDDYDRERNEYFFDRHSEAFGFILLYVRGHGKLRFAPRMCELSFYNEMIYWGLEGAHLEYCCQRRLDDRMSDTYTFYSADEPGALGRDEARPGGAEAAPSRRWLERMRRTFEEPTSSLAAQILASVSVVFVIVSMVVLCASTLPDWRAAAADNRSLDDRSRYSAGPGREPSG